MKESRVSIRYAKALLENAIAAKIQTEVYEDILMIDNLLKVSPDFKRFIASPVIRHNDKMSVLNEILINKVNPLTSMFIVLLAKKGRESVLPDIIKKFNTLYDIHLNRIRVSVVSAVELPDSLKSSINSKLEEFTKKSVISTYNVDKTTIGGMKFKIDDLVFDATLQNQLEKLHQSLSA